MKNIMRNKSFIHILHQQKKVVLLYIVIFAIVIGSSYFMIQLNSSNESNQETSQVSQVTEYVIAQVENTTALQETTTQAQVTTIQETITSTQDIEQISDISEETPTEQVSQTLSTAEIINLFNTAANNAKSNATQIVQEYKNTYVDPDKLVVPSAIKSMCETAMTTFVKDTTDPVTYSTSEEIIENFPVYDETWAAKIEESYIESATYVDNGDTYSVELYFFDCINPADGEGVLAAFPSIDFNSMTESTSIIQNLYVEYTDCSIKAEIDKSTGNLIDATYNLNFFMQMDIVILVTVQAGAAMEYEYYYTVQY